MSGLPTAPSPRRLLLALGLPALLALAQQQLLLRQPPRLLQLRAAAASSGPAALQARFSRPMNTGSLERQSQLQPSLAHRWFGRGDSLLLGLNEGQRIGAPLLLRIGGEDSRGLSLPASDWHWDPRPRILAVVSVPGGEQVQLRDHDGRWRPLSPVWPEIPLLLPLGDGSGLATASRQADGQLRLWRIPLRQHNLRPIQPSTPRQPGTPVPGEPEPLRSFPVLFAHYSSNRRGDLLIQSGQLDPGSGTSELRLNGGGRQRLLWPVSGPMQLLPEGGAVVVPDTEGLHLEALPPQPPRRQTLPGSRDLSSFCPQAGRALLLRHWPDFRRSLELVEPGQPPRQLWLGSQALVASACDRSGERVWALLLEGQERPLLSLVTLSRSGQVLARRDLLGWELEPGTGLHWDPASGQLLAALRPQPAQSSPASPGGPPPPKPAQPVLIDGRSLELRPLNHPVRQVHWLPAG
ncbi:MAG: hypothetical protein KFB97_05615 [Cyanobium sp. M30B3]|nr:MAG: hypothetical protein KFB97_05615 [Cyanobium sp. M30B3]